MFPDADVAWRCKWADNRGAICMAVPLSHGNPQLSATFGGVIDHRAQVAAVRRGNKSGSLKIQQCPTMAVHIVLMSPMGLKETQSFERLTFLLARLVGHSSGVEVPFIDIREFTNQLRAFKETKPPAALCCWLWLRLDPRRTMALLMFCFKQRRDWRFFYTLLSQIEFVEVNLGLKNQDHKSSLNHAKPTFSNISGEQPG